MTAIKLLSNSRLTLTGFCVVCLLAACNLPTGITVHRDGSAHVTTNGVPSDSPTASGAFTAQKKFFSSSAISGLAWAPDSINVAFDIRVIDSLGNYLYPRFNKNYLQFKYSHDTLTLTESDGVAFRDKHAYDCCTFSISIASERKIKSIRTENSFVKQKGNSVIITRKARHLKKGKKKTHLVIVYE